MAAGFSTARGSKIATGATSEALTKKFMNEFLEDDTFPLGDDASTAPMDENWANGPKPRLNGSMITTNKYTGKVVSVLGKVVGAVDSSGKTTTIQTSDGQKLTVRFLEPWRGGPLTGFVEVIGKLVNKNELTCLDLITFADNMTTHFDFEMFNRAIEIYNKHIQREN